MVLQRCVNNDKVHISSEGGIHSYNSYLYVNLCIYLVLYLPGKLSLTNTTGGGDGFLSGVLG